MMAWFKACWDTGCARQKRGSEINVGHSRSCVFYY
jgi:hypothetical protein